MTVATDQQRSWGNAPASYSEGDRVVTLQGDWEHFELIRRGCEQSSGVRLFYFDGTIELLMPGQLHEIFSHAIGTLLTLFLAQQGIVFFATGSADQKQANVAAAQPDQSYCLGGLKEIPDLSIEVVFSRGGVHKLARYQALGVTEVWFWEDGTLVLYHLREGGYEQIEQSELDGLRQLELAVFKQHVMMAETDLGEAVRSFGQYVLQDRR
ncbi:Uma2 family endonuclease [Alkalinema sp. FACHB-956]|uniref:Uma2 family endonuclease n=1 Tax=Alkalinema sp. FACHB-956 TaxID=2692768 RepID=UPI00168590D7|nr:Uma2 family endonuclease [Alkalinema sp. FACHB-956]MBD2326720.1 Uma2 family endonuclease [Alkalinema sp. FACHB-956]